MAQVRALLVQLNRGAFRIRYRIEIGPGHQVLCGWWIEGLEGRPSGLNAVETLIVETLIYADAK